MSGKRVVAKFEQRVSTEHNTKYHVVCIVLKYVDSLTVSL